MDTEIVRLKRDDSDNEALKRAGEIIKKGGLVAFPTETVYGLGGDALNPDSAGKIYKTKGRPSDNPLIVHIADIKDLEVIADNIPEMAYALADKYWPGPLTMIFDKKDIVPPDTTGGLNTVAVRFPSDKAAADFIRCAGGFVAAPSANLSGKPSPTTAARVKEDMDGRIEMILDGGDCNIGLESTIIDLTVDPPAILRPGFVTAEDVVEIAGRLNEGSKDESGVIVHPKAPGMKYRHYAPKGDMTVINGSEDNVIKYINNEVKDAADKGIRCAVIAVDETKDRYDNVRVFSLGSRNDHEKVGHRLYEVLRKLDDEGIEMIYAEAFKEEGFYAAVMNRMKKAAGGKEIKV